MTSPIAYHYLRRILEEEFPAAYLHFASLGGLRYELTNILELCAPLLRGLEGDDGFLKQEITGIIADYLTGE